MKYLELLFLFLFCLVIYRCGKSPMFKKTSIGNSKVNKFLERYVNQSNYKVHELRIENNNFTPKFYLRDISNACELDLGDEKCLFIEENCQNLFAPLEYITFQEHYILINSGLERLIPSKERYKDFWKIMDGKLERCVLSYDIKNDSYEINAPRTSIACDWKFELNKFDNEIRAYIPLKNCAYNLDSLYQRLEY